MAYGGTGDDYIYGSNSSNLLIGGDGKDLIIGGGGDDFIEGDAIVYGGGINWSVTCTITPIGNTYGFLYTYNNVSGAFNEEAYGDDDVIYAGSGNDVVGGDAGDDEIYGGTGNDSLFGGAGNDFIEGGDGNDVIKGDSIDVPLALQGNDYIDGGNGDDLMWGNAGNDDIFGGTGNDSLYGDDGDDYLDGEAGDDFLDGGTGADIMFGGAGNDAYVVDNIEDVVTENAAEGIDTVISFVSYTLPDDVENLTLVGNTAIKGTGNELANVLTSEYSAAGNILDGGLGADTMIGGAGSNTFIVDDIGDVVTEKVNEGIDTVQGSITYTLGANVENLTLTGSEEINGTGNELDNILIGNTAINILYGSDGNDTILGAEGNDTIYGGDGTDWLQGDVGNDYIDGGAGNDDLYGSDGNDMLIGGLGNDTLYGGTGRDTLDGGAGDDILWGDPGWGDAGNDTYLFGRGSGQDTIIDQDSTAGNIDTVLLGSGIVPSDVVMHRITEWISPEISLDSLIISITGSTDTLTLENWFDPTGRWQVEHIQFADATVWDAAMINQRVIQDSTEWDDNLTGTDSAEIINGRGGNDVISGLGGNDTLLGGIGNDTIYGGDGDDTIDGGAGNDYLGGGLGNDTYIFGSGSGVDTIDNYTFQGTGNDVVEFGAGITPNDLEVSRFGDNGFQISIEGTTDVLKILYNFYGDFYIDKVTQYKFADGTTLTKEQMEALGSYTYYGTDSNDKYYGSAGNDTMYGYGGNDSLYGGGGNNAVYGGDGNDYISTDGTGNSTLDGGSGDDCLSGDYGDLLYGGDGNDTLSSNGGNDTLDGGAGNDTLSGSSFSGIDTFIFNRGSGADTIINPYGYQDDIVAFGPGITVADLAVTRVGDDLLININGTTDSLTIRQWFYITYYHKQVGLFTFDDGTTLTANEMDANKILGTSENDNLTGTSGNDYILGYAGNDTLAGSDGYDTLNGGTGADAMIGGASNDIYFVDDAGDVVTENANEGTDTVKSSISYTLGANVENLTLTGSATNGTGNELNNVIVVSSNANTTLNGGAGDDTILGGSGNDYIDGGIGNDTIYGYGGNDTLAGGSDVDQLSGGTGNDTYLFGRGSGQDLVYEGDATPGNMDTILLDSDILPADISLKRTNNYDLLLSIQGTTDTLTISSWYAETGASLVEHIAFCDGTVWWDVDAIRGMTLQQASEGDNELYGTNGADIIHGMGGNDILYGLADNDTLYGDSGNDTLDGGSGADLMIGGTGDDTYIVDDAGDVVTENAGEGTDTILAVYGDYVLGANVENLTLQGGSNGTGNDLNNIIIGNAYGNVLSGGAGDDTLDGQAGNDSLIGSIGNDTYIVDSAGDVITENAAEGTDIILSSVTYTLGANVENLTLTGTSAINGTGNTLNNILTGNSANNTLNGGTGVDTMIGGVGNDTYVVDNTGDVVTENASEGTDTVQSSLTYTLGSNIENLTLTGTSAINGTGNELNNTIQGNTGANTIDGGIGADTMRGGAGNDFYIVDNTADVVTENASEGTDIIQSSVTYTLGSNVENLTLTGSSAINATGNTLNNILTGNSANNTLSGGTGADTMLGGIGNDTYVVDNAADIVTENASAGTDIIQSSVTYTLSANVENLTLTGGTAINGTGNTLDNVLTGNTAANTLTGGAGNDTLSGGTGADTMLGGIGNDTYVVDNTGDVVTENASAGTDIIQSSVTYTLSTNVENLTLTGTSAINGTGNALNNVLTGNAGANVIDGGTGADTMIGGAGNDTYVVDNAADVVTENASEGTDIIQSSVTYTLGSNVENLTLTGTSAINGTGNTLNNTVQGNTGDNTIDGGAGIDTMRGSAGNDIYIVDNTADVVTENASEGTDTVQSSVTYTLATNVENLTLTGTSAINGTGNTLNNILTGNGAINTLSGGTGADTMIGGAGNDTYVVDNAADVVTENASEGTDIIQSSVTYTLGTNVENLTLTGTSAINGTGNTLNNVLTGNAGANVIDGGTGADTMIGGAGNDTYVVDNAADVVTENASAGTDIIQSSVTYTLSSNVENLTLTGTSTINATGNTLNNVLTGNSAGNTLSGGTGTDTMIGGLGDDIYIVDNTTDVVTENASEGTDTIQSSVTYTLSANVENLTLTGSTAINGTGNTLDNYLTGNTAANTLTGGAGNDTLNGGTGADTMIGGAGNNTYIVDNAADVITENASEGTDTVLSSVTYTLGANVENLTLTGSNAISGTGNTLANVLTGNSAVNTLTGNDGNDTLDGGLGNDTLNGGIGNDMYIFRVGSGQDVVNNSDSTAGRIDTIRFEDVPSTGLTGLRQSGNDLILEYGSSDSITITNYFSGTSYQIDRFTFSDGVTYTPEELFGAYSLGMMAAAGTGSTLLEGNIVGSVNDQQYGGDYVKLINPSEQAKYSILPIGMPVDNQLEQAPYKILPVGMPFDFFPSFNQNNQGTERLEVSDGHYITRADIQTIVDTMSAINNDAGMDVIQKYTAMMNDQQYQNILAQSWHQ